VKSGAAVALAQAAHLIPRILDGPPDARRTRVYGPHDVVTDQWAGKTVIDQAAVADCRPGGVVAGRGMGRELGT
jgi:hypothetical protein